MLSHVQLFVTPWTVAHQVLCPWDSPGKNTGVGCHTLLQGIFPTQESNPGLSHCRQILYHLSHQVSMYLQAIKEYILKEKYITWYPFQTLLKRNIGYSNSGATRSFT